MSFTLKTQDKVRNSQLSNSKSKQLYSFSKNPRFHKNIHFNCYQAYYDLPDTKSKRKAGIGYGEKIDFMKLNASNPGPAYYTQKSIFDPKKGKGSVLSMIKSSMQNKSGIGSLSQGRPSTSTNQKKKENQKSSYLLMTPNQAQSKSQEKNFFDTSSLSDRFGSSRKNVPGPASYQFKSDFEQNKGTKFGKANRKEIILPAYYTPGPGAYQIYSEFGFGI